MPSVLAGENPYPSLNMNKEDLTNIASKQRRKMVQAMVASLKLPDQKGFVGVGKWTGPNCLGKKLLLLCAVRHFVFYSKFEVTHHFGYVFSKLSPHHQFCSVITVCHGLLCDDVPLPSETSWFWIPPNRTLCSHMTLNKMCSIQQPVH